LTHLPGYIAGEEYIRWIEVGFNPRSDWAECIEPLATRPLSVDALQVARSDVVGGGVTEDVFGSFFGGDPAPATADDKSKFSLMFNVFGLRGEQDWLARADHARRRLQEDKRRFWHLRVVFGSVRGVISADADDLSRFNRREQADTLQGVFGLFASIRAKR
jgi:hypothetical protein